MPVVKNLIRISTFVFFIKIQMKLLIAYMVAFHLVAEVTGKGTMLLYRPRDVTADCIWSRIIRYDLSFGMGMSDTITLNFQSVPDEDYECIVEIVAEAHVPIIIAIKYPSADIRYNCRYNPRAFRIMVDNVTCVSVCDLQMDSQKYGTPYFTTFVMDKFRFIYANNSSVNAKINALVYQMTATTARSVTNKHKCFSHNETHCNLNNQDFCFTSGVACDGIKNCGVSNWYDERKSYCGVEARRLSTRAVLAVTAALLLVLLAGAHLVMNCLPPATKSLFVFNANEDNRLCLETILEPTRYPIATVEMNQRKSMVLIYFEHKALDSDSESSFADGHDDCSRTLFDL